MKQENECEKCGLMYGNWYTECPECRNKKPMAIIQIKSELTRQGSPHGHYTPINKWRCYANEIYEDMKMENVSFSKHRIKDFVTEYLKG